MSAFGGKALHRTCPLLGVKRTIPTTSHRPVGLPYLPDDMVGGCLHQHSLQRLGVNRHKGFIARRRADHVVSVDDGQLGLRRIWAISHDHLDHSRDCRRGRCCMARREGATEKRQFSIVVEAPLDHTCPLSGVERTWESSTARSANPDIAAITCRGKLRLLFSLAALHQRQPIGFPLPLHSICKKSQ